MSEEGRGRTGENDNGLTLASGSAESWQVGRVKWKHCV